MSKSLNDFTKYSYGKYTRGRVVLHRFTGDLGHITGFDRVFYDHGHETILLVKWEDGTTNSIHISQIELLTD